MQIINYYNNTVRSGEPQIVDFYSKTASQFCEECDEACYGVEESIDEEGEEIHVCGDCRYDGDFANVCTSCRLNVHYEYTITKISDCQNFYTDYCKDCVEEEEDNDCEYMDCKCTDTFVHSFGCIRLCEEHGQGQCVGTSEQDNCGMCCE